MKEYAFGDERENGRVFARRRFYEKVTDIARELGGLVLRGLWFPLLICLVLALMGLDFDNAHRWTNLYRGTSALALFIAPPLFVIRTVYALIDRH
ncbi:MAG: hypothetical protein EOP24_36960 [Hyphomicrobiales bacterium]|nr:MAG: hypothetical protein EOP24_36960 [Hyphomicrobiales bacterium]